MRVVDKNVLVVCKGNICRSPFVEVVLKTNSFLKNIINVRSRATEDYHVNKGAHPLGILTARKLGYDLTRHVARQISSDDVKWSDLIIIMDELNRKRLKEQFGVLTDCRKILNLGEYLIPPQAAIPDPYKGNIDAFKYSFDLIKSACDRLINKEFADIEQ